MESCFFFTCFLGNSGSFLIIFSSVAPHRGEHAARCHPRWQPTRRLAVSCGLGRHRFEPRTAGHQSVMLPLSHHASLLSHHASLLRPHASLLSHHASILSHHASQLSHHASLLSHHASLLSPHASLLSHHASLMSHHASLEPPCLPKAIMPP